MNFLNLLESLTPDGASMAVLCVAIFTSTFVLEEGAAVLASALILTDKLPLPLASIVLYAGVVSSDVGLYGLGRAASRFKWAARWVSDDKMRRAQAWVGKHQVPAIILSRLQPWLLPPTFIACGFFGLSFRRFLLSASLTAAVWIVVALGVMLKCGTFLLNRSAPVAMVATLVFAGGYYAWCSRRRANTDHGGMPGAPMFCWYDALPPWLFYIPVALFWLVLSVRYKSLTLPTATNPSFETGGLVGESKLQVLSQVAAEGWDWFAPYTGIQRSHAGDLELDVAAALAAMSQAGLSFPVVAKPDRGHHGHGVQLIQHESELGDYVAGFPVGETIMLQKLVSYEGEAGVFYVRLPGQRSGQIFSLNLSECAKVIGDGVSSLEVLIRTCASVSRGREALLAANAERLDWVPPVKVSVPLAFARSHRLGAILKNGQHLVTPELLARFDQIANSINEFHFGRFEVRFRSLREFQQGEGFQILEVNGAGAEANHIWDGEFHLWDAYKTLLEQFSLAFRIGDLNRKRGFQAMSVRSLWQFYRRQSSLLPHFPDAHFAKQVVEPEMPRKSA